MKRIIQFIMSITIPCLVLGLTACSSKQTTDTKLSEIQVSSARQDIIASKEREISDLENKLDKMRDMEQVNSIDREDMTNRTSLNNQYTNLGQARAQLNELRVAEDEADFVAKQAELEKTVASIRSTLDQPMAE
jgi:hypothetical protein